MTVDPPLADWERQYLDTTVRGEFFARHQHLIINALEVAAIQAGTPQLRAHFEHVAADAKGLPCEACR